MSEERNYPVTAIQEALQLHLEDARAVPDGQWMADVIALLIKEAQAVPRPVERADVLPDYIYPH